MDKTQCSTLQELSRSCPRRVRRALIEPALAIGAVLTVSASACAVGQSLSGAGDGSGDASGSTGSDMGIDGAVSSGDNGGQTSDSGASGDDSTSFGMDGGDSDGDAPFAEAAPDSAGVEAGTGSVGDAAGGFDADGSGPPATGLSALYAVGTSTSMSAYVGCEIAVQNSASTTVAVSGLTARYYYTDEVRLPPQITVQWSHISTSGPDVDLTVTTTVAPLAPATLGADTYIEFAFSSVHSALGHGESAVFSWQMHGPDPAKDVYAQTNDYSFDASKTVLTPWDHVVLVQNGNIVWGKAP